MIFHQINGQNSSMSFWGKISLILWICISLALLSFFTFTIFIIGLVAGVVIFALRFFRRNTSSKLYMENNDTVFTNKKYRTERIKDDDIIDI